MGNLSDTLKNIDPIKYLDFNISGPIQGNASVDLSSDKNIYRNGNRATLNVATDFGDAGGLENVAYYDGSECYHNFKGGGGVIIFTCWLDTHYDSILEIFLKIDGSEVLRESVGGRTGSGSTHFVHMPYMMYRLGGSHAGTLISVGFTAHNWVRNHRFLVMEV